MVPLEMLAHVLIDPHETAITSVRIPPPDVETTRRGTLEKAEEDDPA